MGGQDGFDLIPQRLFLIKVKAGQVLVVPTAIFCQLTEEVGRRRESGIANLGVGRDVSIFSSENGSLFPLMFT